MRRLRGIDAMRREFTANVTHEFKTPIASSLGASELIRDGVVKPEDIRNFAGHIHDDARRLSSLVSDILTLSKLDESERSLDLTVLGSLSPCDLLDIARDVVARLRAKAENAHVTLTFEGKPIVVRGYPR
jgi:two-component system phosphate regulon sensor histidine kinase PhoR